MTRVRGYASYGRGWRALWLASLCFWLTAGTFALFAAETNAVPDPLTLAPVIVRRALEKAAAMDKSEERSRYLFHLDTTVEDLDARGKVKHRREKEYEAKINGGWTALRLLRINGEDLTPAQMRKEEEKDLRFRQQATQSSSPLGSDRRENFFTPELIHHFRFRLKGHETIEGRPAFVLEFFPRDSAAPVKNAPDRLLNQVSGTMWIDEEEFEVAKAEFKLNGEVNLWGGILASLKKMDAKLVRQRLAPGIWFNLSFDAFLEGRKLADPFHLRVHSASSQFHLLAVEPAPKSE